MAILQVSQIQQRRGLQQDLPQLASGELGWSIDTRKLYIGNGTLAEGAPTEGQTEILTQFSILDFTTGFSANVAALQANVTILQGNVTTIEAQILELQAGSTTSNTATLLDNTSGTVTSITNSNAVITYTLLQNSKQRTGTIRMSRNGSTVSHDEEFSETATTKLDFSFDASSGTHADLNYHIAGAGTDTNLLYRIQSQI